MAEDLKMDLRPKRRPRYRPSDVRMNLYQEQDPENASYSRPNYVKMSVATHSHQYVSPSVILNQNAKLLVKFINKANKNIRDIRVAKEESQKEVIKIEPVPKDKSKNEPTENPKKQAQSSKTQKTQPPKKNKELYNFKGLHQNSELIKNLSQEQMLKGVKGIQNLSGLINNRGIYSGPLANQITQLQSLYPNLKDLNYQSLTQSPNPNLFEFNKQHNPNQPENGSNNGQFGVQGYQKSQKQLANQITSDTGRQQAGKPAGKTAVKHEDKGSEKIFKRSAYHVAIAYHIYLKGLYEQGITSGNLIDPTYRARVIKEQSGIGNDQE